MAAGKPTASTSFFSLAPANLILTALKRSEDTDHVVVRFYEAEGFECTAQLRFLKPVRQAYRTNLIEDNEESLPVGADGSLSFPVRPWEIVTLKVEF